MKSRYQIATNEPMQKPAAVAAHALRRRVAFLHRRSGTIVRCEQLGTIVGTSRGQVSAIHSRSFFHRELHTLVSRKLDICPAVDNAGTDVEHGQTDDMIRQTERKLDLD